jgi:hypothetical protein
MRGQASKELSSVSLKSWKDLASRLGGNARVLTWARALCAGKTDAELAEIAEHAGKELPEWMPGDEASEEMRAELSRLFLVHMAYEQARAAFGEAALLFVKRARVFEAAVPKEAFRALAEGLDIDIDRDLDALANSGLLEVGSMARGGVGGLGEVIRGRIPEGTERRCGARAPPSGLGARSSREADRASRAPRERA